MMSSMELSLYPLGSGDVSGAVKRFVEALREKGCEVQTGPMSSLVYGESGGLFSALGYAYEKACMECGVVLVVKVSNACMPSGSA